MLGDKLHTQKQRKYTVYTHFEGKYQFSTQKKNFQKNHQAQRHYIINQIKRICAPD